MTSEEMQRTMEFILDQQAQYAARMQRDESLLTRLEDAFVTLVQMATLTDERLDGLAQTSEEMHRTMEFILEQQAQYTAKMQKDESRVARLEDAFVTLVRMAKLTDERLGTLEEKLDSPGESQDNGKAGN